MSASQFYNEKRLLEKVAEGDESAFSVLFYRYADLLGTFVLRFTHSQTYAEEIVQNVFLKIWMSREVLAAVENFKVYLFVVSRNQTLNAMRKILRENIRHKEWEMAQVNLQSSIIEADDNDTNDEYLFGLIDKAIAQLPPQQRKAWLLSRKEGLTHRRIAQAMNLSQETIKKYIMAANKTLVAYIQLHLSAESEQ